MHEGTGEAWVVSEKGVVGVRELTKRDRRGRVVWLGANSSLVEGRAVVPVLEGEVGRGRWVWGTAVFAMTSEREGWREEWESEWERCPRVPIWLGI